MAHQNRHPHGQAEPLLGDEAQRPRLPHAMRLQDVPPCSAGDGVTEQAKAWTAVQIACPQCGELVEVADPTALILALHMQNDCMSNLMAHHDGSSE